MEVFNKPPLTYEKQVELLLSRGLIVTDRKRAERYLANISYYRLSAYMLPYKKKENGIIIDAFKEGTTWDDIYDLYVFDRKLRLLVFRTDTYGHSSSASAVRTAFCGSLVSGKWLAVPISIPLSSMNKRSKW